MNFALIKELLDGTGRRRRHELNQLASGQIGWGLAPAVLCDKRGLGDVDSIVFNTVPANIEQYDLNGVLPSDLISEKEQFLQFGIACAQE